MRLENYCSHAGTGVAASLWEYIKFAFTKKFPISFNGRFFEWDRYAYCGDIEDIRYGYFMQIIPHWNGRSPRFGVEWLYYDHPYTIINFSYLQWGSYTPWTPWNKPNEKE